MSRFPATLPSTTALRVFECAARCGSFTIAAEELSLTQSAVSHQIRGLESVLGIQLFERAGRGMALTNAGETYSEHVSEVLQGLLRAQQTVQRGRDSNVLTVSCSPNFAQKWLVPRLGSFAATCSDIDLRISASARHVDLQADGIDIAIRHGQGKWPGLIATKLCNESLFPVCSPYLLASAKTPFEVAELAQYSLIHDQQREGWENWLEQVGVSTKGFSLQEGAIFSQTSFAIDAAIAVQGVALARSALVELDLQEGRLVRPVKPSVSAVFAYWIVHQPFAESDSLVTSFKNWLLEQIQDDN